MLAAGLARALTRRRLQRRLRLAEQHVGLERERTRIALVRPQHPIDQQLAVTAGGVVATLLSMISSWLCAIYVEQIAPLGATYGSVGAVVVLLIWLSWNVNAIFYGGAFATEMEIAAHSIITFVRHELPEEKPRQS